MAGPSFSEMRKHNLFTDAVIKSNSGLKWNVHRVVMSPLGKFICNAFSVSSFDGTLNMSVSDEVGQCLIDLAYTDNCDINHDNVLDAMEAAIMYQLESLVQLCIDFILGNMMTSEHVISVKTFLRIHQEGLKSISDGVLLEVVDKWIRKNFNDIFETEYIYELSFEELENYVKEDDLNISEEDLLEFLLRYATIKNLDSEKTTQLLSNVRQSLISFSKLSQIVENNPALSSEIEKARDTRSVKKTRLPRDIAIVLTKHSMKTHAEIFNIRKNEWKIIENCGIDLPADQNCLSLGNVIYYFGAFQPRRSWRSMKAIDLNNGHSFEAERLHLPDISDDEYGDVLSLAAWNGKIVALVGSNSGTFYDPKENKWSEFPTCQISRLAELVVINGNLFAIGGVNKVKDDEDIGSIEYYDSNNNEWIVCGSLKKLRGCIVAAAVDGKVFVFSEDGEEQDGECFQPVLENGRMNLIWLPSVKSPWKFRENWRVSVIDNKLLFIGGTDFNENSEFISHVKECHIFSPRTWEWSQASDTSTESCWESWDMALTVNTSDMGIDRIEELCGGKFIVPENSE